MHKKRQKLKCSIYRSVRGYTDLKHIWQFVINLLRKQHMNLQFLKF